MIKAVFFDWFNTLVRYEPPRYQLHTEACRHLGIEVLPEEIVRSVQIADGYYYEENGRSPVERRSAEEKARVYTRYQGIVLAEAGVEVSEERLVQVMEKVHQLFRGVTFSLFDDVLPAMAVLKQQGLVLGMLTNAGRELVAVYHQLGLEPYLDFVVTSEEAGSDKPQPGIFLMALERAGAPAVEAVHVGDQYKIDIVGARGVGINPVLIDRDDLYPDFTECPRIRSLPEIVGHIQVLTQ